VRGERERWEVGGERERWEVGGGEALVAAKRFRVAGFEDEDEAPSAAIHLLMKLRGRGG
jgi:hypothetical protein